MGEQPKEYQCSWCKRNKFNGDESCPLDLEGTNGNSDIFDGVNRVIKSCGCGAFVDTRSRPAPASASENIELYVLKVLSDSREEILERLSSPFSPETIREMQEITRKHDAAIAAKEREKVQPFIDLARVLATKCDEMQDLMRRNKIVIDNVQEPMQKLAFTFYSEIAELAHKAEVVIEEYEESLREGAGKPDKGR